MTEFEFESTPETDAMLKQICVKEPTSKETVNLLNQLVEEAVKDGGDCGGAYHQNQTGLSTAIENLLQYLKLTDYEVVDTKNFHNWSNLKIQLKEE